MMSLSLLVKTLIVIATIGIALFAQTPPELADARLKANASLPQNNHPGIGTPISQALADARALAPSKGVTWKGLDLVVLGHPNVAGLGIPGLLRRYEKLACQADVIAVGHITSSAYHLSSSGTAVYGDHIFVIDNLLKDNHALSIRGRPNIVVTGPGGSLTLPDGPIKFEVRAFPLLQTGVTHLQFLRYIPQSSAYQAIDDLSTLVATENNWVIARKDFSGLAMPGFTRGGLEARIGHRLTSCK